MHKKYKSIFISVAVLVWVGIVLYAITANPSNSESQERLSQMNKQMVELMKAGGRVLRLDENAKLGGARISRVLSDEGWGGALLESYNSILIKNGWIKVGGKNIEYCKNGILLTIESHAGVEGGVGVNYVGMVYTASSIRECRKKLPYQ